MILIVLFCHHTFQFISSHAALNAQHAGLTSCCRVDSEVNCVLAALDLKLRPPLVTMVILVCTQLCWLYWHQPKPTVQRDEMYQSFIKMDKMWIDFSLLPLNWRNTNIDFIFYWMVFLLFLLLQAHCHCSVSVSLSVLLCFSVLMLWISYDGKLTLNWVRAHKKEPFSKETISW